MVATISKYPLVSKFNMHFLRYMVYRYTKRRRCIDESAQVAKSISVDLKIKIFIRSACIQATFMVENVINTTTRHPTEL